MMNKKGQEYLGAVIGIGFVVVFIIGVILLAMGYDTVAANHLGVMNTMGELKGVMNPGFKFTGFFTNVVSYDMRIRKVKVDMLTEQSSASDNTGQVIFGSVSVNYKIKYSTDVVTKLYQQIGTDEQIEDKLNIVAIIKEGFKQATVKHEAMDILQNRQQVKEEAIANIRKNFPTDYLEIDQIVVEDIDFTPGFKKAIDDKKIATQNKLKEQEQVQVVMFQQQQEIEKFIRDGMLHAYKK